MSLVAVKIKAGKEFNIFALRQNEKCELLDFLGSLPRDEMAKIHRYFDRTKDFGLIRDTEIFKPIGDGFFEFRTWRGVRVFAFLEPGKMMICTGGYIKKKKKLDPKEIARAKLWKLNYEVAKAEKKLTFEDGVL
jgi:hypothetical protein